MQHGLIQLYMTKNYPKVTGNGITSVPFNDTTYANLNAALEHFYNTAAPEEKMTVVKVYGSFGNINSPVDLTNVTALQILKKALT